MTHLAVILSGVAFALVAIGIVIALGVMAYKRNKEKIESDTASDGKTDGTVPKEHELVSLPAMQYYRTQHAFDYFTFRSELNSEIIKEGVGSTTNLTLDNALKLCVVNPFCIGVEQNQKGDGSMQWNEIAQIWTILTMNNTPPPDTNDIYLLEERFPKATITDMNTHYINNEIHYVDTINQYNFYATEESAGNIEQTAEFKNAKITTLKSAMDFCNTFTTKIIEENNVSPPCLGISKDDSGEYSMITKFNASGNRQSNPNAFILEQFARNVE